MKKIRIELKVTNITDNCSSRQELAGNIPGLQVMGKSYKSDISFDMSGLTDEELIHKLFINVLGTYCRAINCDDKFIDDLVNKRTKFKSLYCDE